MKVVLFLGLLLALSAVAGCQATTPAGPPMQPTGAANPNAPQAALVMQSNKPRTVLKNASPDLAQLTAGNNAFALDLYQKLRGQPGNLFYSPYSISEALAMTYAGARGATADQMARTLHFSLDQNRLHPAFNSLDQLLASRGQGAQGKDDKGFRLRVANSLWGDKGYKFLPDFLDTLATNYGAGLRLLDMKNAPEPSRQTINQWVLDQTENKIKDLIPQGAITPDSKLVLANAIYFNAAWADPFDKNATQDGPFHLQDGTTINVPMMRHAGHYSLTQEDGYMALELPYSDRDLSMRILLPDPGKFDAVQASITGDRVVQVLGAVKTNQVLVTMPRWKFESSFSLADTLQSMGMTDAFKFGPADFSGMDGTRNLFISAVEHKAFVAVDEDGTEAAAATAVVMTAGAARAEPLAVTLDRPFIFLIHDTSTGQILFVGRVMDPRGQ